MGDSKPNATTTDGVTPASTLSWARHTRTSCDACKQMKIKCHRNDNESCKRCSARKLYCTTTPVERKKRKLTNKKETYLEEMDDRIKRMESAIITSGLHSSPEPPEENEEDKKSSEKIEDQAKLSNHLSNLVMNQGGSPNFIGWSSGFSLLSPQGLRWISGKVGDKDELAQLISKMARDDYGVWGQGEVDLWYPMPRALHTPLPRKEVALQYVNCFFTTYNTVFPILNRRMFNINFERQYSLNPPTSIAWYALFNIVLCIGCIRTKRKEMHWVGPSLTDYISFPLENGSEYFRNASCCFHDLLFKEANLMAMQAMSLLLFITNSSPNPQPAYVLTTSAMNLAITLGLHRSLDGFGFSPEEIEQRRNVFWVFYLLEKAISHNLGRPSLINDDDIAIELPSKKPGITQSLNGGKIYDIFQDQVTLAIIGSRICSELYSSSSQTKSEADRMKVLGKLDSHLQSWRDAIPVEIRPEHPIWCSDEQYASVVMMHFAYLDTVILLHRLPGHQKSLQNGKIIDEKMHDQQAQFNLRVRASHLLCLAAARRSIRLLDAISKNEKQNQYLTWMALYYPLSASLILITNILSNPQDDHAASDVGLMGLIILFFTNFIQPGSSFDTTPTVIVFRELHTIITRLVGGVIPDTSQPATTYSGLNAFSLQPPALEENQQNFWTEPNVQNGVIVESSPESAEDSPLNFAPFMGLEPSQFDYDPTYDPMPVIQTSDFDMNNLWGPSFTTELWPSEI